MEYTWVTLKKNNWGHTHKMLHVLFVSAKAISCITSDRCYKIICDDAFLRRPAISKINTSQRAVSCEAEEDVDSGFKWLLHLSDVSRL
jgi:hypothetical protein